ncbi:hypothetical protein KUL17_10690 [Alteromonas sp. KUL17]|uniref:hypothetical protein n=1 Tax=Alteromonas sp. KUL17 TaxID=2480796 RepID=UPI00103805FC|nr:hypothetical protein [Alteromonas sp. KUL17]TAP29776.1 hypothetical protein KUL49_05365 [Alteromonas sp. KUL17]GEA02172.1 hypothetical protein KUL17_10690 [Alteromonas sp. KUL17]|tara:strand:+ start:817 stop:1758 length:942 start_codon:yes stop_codon:yes gene_type:complete
MDVWKGNKLEIHYYFSDSSHEIDALIRNKCESELLAIAYEAASVFDIPLKLVSEPTQEGGFKEFWTALGDNSAQLQVLLVAIGVVTTIYFSYTPEEDERKKTLEELQIQELKLRLKDMTTATDGEKLEVAEAVANKLSKNLKITKRRSNFYSHLNNYPKVSFVSISAISKERRLKGEVKLPRSEFKNFILSSNRLKVQEVDSAEIEIISPVLKDGNYKWKGIYEGYPISFSMTDNKFRDAIFIDGLKFHAGTTIRCLLQIHRELDEIGEVKIKSYSVPTVIDILDGPTIQRTKQGKAYIHAKKMRENQNDLFG